MTITKTKKQEMELSKYIKSESIEILRSRIHFASYNPRTLSEEEKKTIKRGIKRFGLVGGLVVNKQTGMTVVSGHQRITVMDELNKYPEKDYLLRVDLIDVSEKEEKELNILLNNPNAQGKWDTEALAAMIPDIDYSAAGLTDEDLMLIGCDYFLQTDGEVSIASDLEDLYTPVLEQRDQAKSKATKDDGGNIQGSSINRVQDLKSKKEAVAQKSIGVMEEMNAFVMISFSKYEDKAAFCEMFGYEPDERNIKGEVFVQQIESLT